MKRISICFILVALMCNVGFADEYTSVNNNSTTFNNKFISGGFEFQYSQKNAFVIEFGGRTEAPVGKRKNQFSPYTNSSPVLTIGYRTLAK